MSSGTSILLVVRRKEEETVDTSKNDQKQGTDGKKETGSVSGKASAEQQEKKLSEAHFDPFTHTPYVYAQYF